MNMHLALPAMRAIADQIAPHCDGDDRLLLDMIEGETGHDARFLIERLHEQIARDTEMLTGIAERERDLKERKSRIKARSEKMKEQIGVILRAVHVSKIELPEVTYSVRDGKPKLAVTDPDAVPADYSRVKTEPDMALIKDVFTDTETLPNWLTWQPASDVVTARNK